MTSWYPLLLTLHSNLRWLVLVSGIFAVLVSLRGLAGGHPFKPLGRISGLIYVSLLDTQFLTGLFLSFASPVVTTFWSNPALGIKQHDPRFFAIEHTILMVVALGIAHVGAARSRRAESPRPAYRAALIGYALSMLVILGGIPWWRGMV
jgi:hypothetical protein